MTSRMRSATAAVAIMSPSGVTAAVIVLLLSFAGPAPASGLAFGAPTVFFDDAFSHLFGHDNFVRSPDGRGARLSLNRYSGSGFVSNYFYDHGFFSASIQLPSNHTAGVVVAFYTSNGDVFEKTHDELDFEFLGKVKGKEWKIQTNVYGNGSTARGREERYLLPFDPTAEPHRYSILWTSDRTIFYIDETPIREVVRSAAMGGDYPSKPMSIYATIWDGSSWATSNGKYKINYDYEPFVSDFSDLVVRGCRVDPVQEVDSAIRCAEAIDDLLAADFASISPRKRAAMRRFRQRYMTYSFCYDTLRYPVLFPDCDIVPSEQSRFSESGETKYPRDRRRSTRRSRKPRPADADA